MRIRLNLTWLVLTILLAALIGGGVYGWIWWQAQPNQLYASAQKYYALAEAARKREDSALAKQHYEYADKQLETMLDKKAPQHTRAWLMRFHTLHQLALIAA